VNKAVQLEPMAMEEYS